MKMKKLMLLIAVAGLAFAGQAMTVDWQYNATSADVGKTVYVMLGSSPQTTWASLAAIEDAALGSGEIKKKVNKYNAAGQVADAGITKTSADLYYVIVSADKSTFDVTTSQDFTAKVYDPNNQESTPGNSTAISSATAMAATGQSYSGVPEPTSGMLMIVGLGALALRRRRA